MIRNEESAQRWLAMLLKNLNDITSISNNNHLVTATELNNLTSHTLTSGNNVTSINLMNNSNNLNRITMNQQQQQSITSNTNIISPIPSASGVFGNNSNASISSSNWNT